MSGVPAARHVSTTSGPLNVLDVPSADDQAPVLVLLHQTPRSLDEFAPMLPLLGGYRVVVPDLPGYGASPAGPNTIEHAAQAVLALLDALGIERAHVLGHHFGGLVGYDMSARSPDRVVSLALSSAPYIDAPERERRKDAPPFNAVPVRSDGGHLAELWQRRSQYLGVPDPGVLSRYVRDVLGHEDPDHGHAAVAAYRSEDRVGIYEGPVLCIASAKDPRAFPVRHRIRSVFPGARTLDLADGDISTPETCPQALADAVITFHREDVR